MAEINVQRTLLAAYMITGVNMAGMIIYLSSMPFLFPGKGMDMVTLGYFQSFIAFLQLCWAPLSGRLADSIGPRNVMVFCLLSACGALFMMGAANTLFLLIASRFVSICQDVMPATQMIVTDIVDEDNRAAALGRVMIPVSVGIVVGPLIAGTMTGVVGLQTTLLILSAMPVLCIAVAVMFIPKHTKPKITTTDDAEEGSKLQQMWKLVSANNIPSLLLMRFLVMLPFMMIMMNSAMISVKYFDISSQNSHYLMSASGIINMVNHGFIVGFVNKKFKQDQLLMWCSIGLCISFTLLMSAQVLWYFFLVQVLLSTFFCVLDNLLVVALTKAVPSSDSNTMVGLSTAVFHFARSLSPALGAIILSGHGIPAFAMVGLSCSVVLLSIIMLNRRTS